MSVDLSTVKHVAHLARIFVSEEDAQCLVSELNAILEFVTQLNQVNVHGVEPMISVKPMAMRMREDVICDGSKALDIVANAPLHEDHFFLVPKVIE